MRVPTHGRIRPTSPTQARKHWGGFLLVRRNPQLLHIRLTGQFSLRSMRGIEREVSRLANPSSTIFVVLDATRLDHIPLHVARRLAACEPFWRARGVVAIWVGLNPYLSDLLTLACGNDQQVPALADWPAVQQVFAEVRDRPAPVARGRLMSSSALVH